MLPLVSGKLQELVQAPVDPGLHPGDLFAWPYSLWVLRGSLAAVSLKVREKEGIIHSIGSRAVYASGSPNPFSWRLSWTP